MPYKSERIKLSKKQDRRIKLTEEQRDEIRHKYSTGLYSQRKLAAEYNVSRRLVTFVLDPEKEERCRSQFKERRKDGRYKETNKERAAIQKEYRHYKQSLYLKGELVDIVEEKNEKYKNK